MFAFEVAQELAESPPQEPERRVSCQDAEGCNWAVDRWWLRRAPLVIRHGMANAIWIQTKQIKNADGKLHIDVLMFETKKRTHWVFCHCTSRITVSLLEERAPCCCKPRPYCTQFSIQEHPERKVFIGQLSHEKSPLTFHYTGCLIGLLIMACYNPHITGQYNSLYTLNNEVFFHCSVVCTCCVQKGLQCLKLAKSGRKPCKQWTWNFKAKTKILCVSVASKIILSASGSVASAAVPSAQRAANGQRVRVSNYAFRS